MTRRAVQLAIVTIFAVVLAHAGLRAWGPATMPEYFAEGDGKALLGPQSDGIRGKFTYLRRTMHFARRPSHFWLDVAAHDEAQVYVNGQLVANAQRQHYWGPGGASVDLTPYISAGKNVIAIAAQQIVALRPPMVSVRGGYTIEKRSHHFGTEGRWLCAHAFEHGRTWWFGVDFDDRSWKPAKRVDAHLRARVDVPPRAISTPRTASWITAPRIADSTAAVRREFHLASRPRSGWIRITPTCAYRLAINGVLVDVQDEAIAMPRPNIMQRSYDVTPALRRGHNVVSMQLLSEGPRPHVLADMQVEDVRGVLHDLGTGGAWQSRGELSTDWIQDRVDATSWQPSVVEAGDLGMNLYAFPRDVTDVTWPGTMIARRFAFESAWALAIGLAALFACGRMARNLARRLGEPGAGHLAYLALLVPVAALLTAMVATYDPRYTWQTLLSPAAVLLAIVSVPAQWLFLWMRAGQPETPPCEKTAPAWQWRLSPPVTLLLILVVAGGWLRLRDLTVEPIHHDEVSAYYFTQGIIEGGFPGGQPRRDIPFGYAATSELTYFPSALVDLFTDDPLLILRIPAALFSIATIGLVYFMGARLFSPWVGLMAAAIYTFAPYEIGMSNFGRYFAQLQFFTLTTIYFFWQIIKGKERIDAKAVWLTGISFLLMYFSWEGSGFLALGMVGAALVQRRGNMGSILRRPVVWTAMLVMILAFLVQDNHRIFQQTQRLWWGVGISNLQIFPMWRYPLFVPSFYFTQLSWVGDSLLPVILLALAMLIAMRHVWQDELRMLLITMVGTTCLMTALLPLRASRYDYHLTPLAILVSAAVVGAALRGALAGIERLRLPRWSLAYSHVVAAGIAVAVIAIGSGSTVQLSDHKLNTSLAYRYGDLKFPHWDEPLRYLREHFRDGDIVIATFPHLVDHTMAMAKDSPMPLGWVSDYWLQSTLVLQATLDDVHDNPLDRRAGTPMIASLDQLEDIFARHPRVWYAVSYGPSTGLNDAIVSEYLRKNMTVVYEDYNGALMVRDSHRTAGLRQRDDVNLRYGRANFLP